MLIPAPFQNSAQPIVFVSAAGVIKDCNQALSELLGFHRLELLNKSITFLIHYPRELFQELLLLGEKSRLFQEVQLTCKGADAKWVEIHVNRFVDGQESGFLMFVYDVSHRMSIQNQLIELQKRLSDFGYLTSHALRLPVANIMGLSALLDDAPVDINELKELTANLKLSSNQLNEVVHQLNNVIYSLKSFSERKMFYTPGKRPNLVMLVDDDPINNFVNKRLFNKFDPSIQVEDYLNAQEGLVRLQSGMHTPDILFLDLTMPMFDGWRFLDELSKLVDSDLRVILLCTTISNSDYLRCKDYPFVVDCIEKPLTIERVDELIYPGK